MTLDEQIADQFLSEHQGISIEPGQIDDVVRSWIGRKAGTARRKVFLIASRAPLTNEEFSDSAAWAGALNRADRIATIVKGRLDIVPSEQWLKDLPMAEYAKQRQYLGTDKGDIHYERTF